VKTDSIFYQIFQAFPSFFFELIDRPPQDAIAYQFSSVEIKQLAFRIDGVFLPHENAPDRPIYFVEVQFQSDPQFYSRFFAEIFLYLHKTELENDWRGIVVYPRRSIDTGNTRRYRELLNSPRVRRIYLDELADTSQESLGLTTLKLIVTNESAAIEQGRELIARIRGELENEQQQQNLLQLIETILVYKLPQMNREEIEAMFTLSDLRQTQVYQEALEEGRGEGREEGRLLAKLESIPRFFALGLSVEQIARALDIEIERVRQILQDNNKES
jgi:predicted transposase/invertase (TIGR01784 family)